MASDPIEFNGIEYICTRDAAKLTGYTSDYVGQLAREGKIPSKLVGRVRFVDKEEVLEYKNTVTNGTAASSTPVEEEKEETTTKQTAEKTERDIHTESEVESTRVVREAPPIKYFADDRPVLPTLSKARPVSETEEKQPVIEKDTRAVSKEQAVRKERERRVSKVPSRDLSQERRFSFPYGKFATALVVLVIVLGLFSVLGTDLQVDDRFTTDGTRPLLIMTDEETARQASERAEEAVAREEPEQLELRAAVMDALRDVWFRIASDISAFFAGLFTPTEDSEIVQAPATVYEPEGLVVVPSTGDEGSDAAIIQSVERAFSDEVRVFPDDDGRSGVVQPIFREGRGQPFLYVLVPIEEEDGTR